MNLVISKGPKPSEKVEVPQLVGLTKDQAEAALASVGLKGNATEEANEADEGQVFEQGTEAGKEVRRARPSLQGLERPGYHVRPRPDRP